MVLSVSYLPRFIDTEAEIFRLVEETKTIQGDKLQDNEYDSVSGMTVGIP